MSWLDLTRPMDRDLPIYREAVYADPAFEVTPWCDVTEQGYCVTQLCMGTQTGTHIDAPRHFIPSGKTLEHVELDWLVGPYHWVEVGLHDVSVEYRAAGPHMLFIRFRPQARLSFEQFHALLAGPEPVWVLDGAPGIVGQDMFYFHRTLAAHGKFLVEDLQPDAAAKVGPGGELIAWPLRLVGTSGSPCRVAWRPA
ncbi:kynurenine formamidase [Chitinivorax tropicus]|uniref:Kynurenine formamidase n=1 Tax=Chitinivorax tropicus TaxID=714531 RepID=A0A840MN47_9PROT|nr:cyclase family protein [Chitinivorax tropicus]MBB5018529.1 kynurenine formamidase [Chitinivorax tropicus]